MSELAYVWINIELEEMRKVSRAVSFYSVVPRGIESPITWKRWSVMSRIQLERNATPGIRWDDDGEDDSDATGDDGGRGM
jgi:hypothetical protein